MWALQEVAPTTPALARRCAPPRPLYRWGLVPAWNQKPKTTCATFNARTERVASAPAFRFAYGDPAC